MKPQQLKFNLIDKLIALKDDDILHKVEKLLATTKTDASEKFHLTDEQLKMMVASEEDIKYGRTITDKELNDEEDLN